MTKKEELDLYQQRLVQFLKEKFCSPFKIDGQEVTRNIYAKKCGIAGSTLTRITKVDVYDVPISTIYKFCNFENTSVKAFFIEFEEKVKENKSVD